MEIRPTNVRELENLIARINKARGAGVNIDKIFQDISEGRLRALKWYKLPRRYHTHVCSANH